ncbi:Os02g0295001 [Oryza sativa Japonica Group]|uniref:Os02g0295001 protein n=1 Tax=Oryza sativa subsp. japonica TaxID=39947 RepID=A0A0P0VHV0_ORYSJ|nr:Os02g0295001 [Oryza sativa Japonica Group]
MMSIAGRNMAQIRSADMACDQKGGLHGKELTPEGDFLVAFLRFEDLDCKTRLQYSSSIQIYALFTADKNKTAEQVSNSLSRRGGIGDAECHDTVAPECGGAAGDGAHRWFCCRGRQMDGKKSTSVGAWMRGKRAVPFLLSEGGENSEQMRKSLLARLQVAGCL